MTKRIMFINRRAPYGTVYGLEALDAMLAASAFDQDICAAFVDDGVFQLKQDQNPSVLDMKHYTKTFAVLPDFGIDHLFVEKESMTDRGVSKDDLIEVLRDDGSDAVSIISADSLSEIMESQHVVLQF